MAKLKVKKASQKTIKGGHAKYGFIVDHPNFKDTWINVVDWDNETLNGVKPSPGDTIDISKPENGEYGWSADFITGETPQSSTGEEPQGFSNSEVDDFTLNRVLAAVEKNRELLTQILQEMDVRVTSKQGDIDYPEPTKDEMMGALGDGELEQVEDEFKDW